MRAIFLYVLTGLAMTPALGGNPAGGPVTNPFERPAWLSEAREVAQSAHSAKVRLDLRATLLGETPLANVGGRIVMPGEVVAGYTLVSVSEGAAEFSDGERTVQVTVRPQAKEDDDD